MKHDDNNDLKKKGLNTPISTSHISTNDVGGLLGFLLSLFAKPRTNNDLNFEGKSLFNQLFEGFDFESFLKEAIPDLERETVMVEQRLINNIQGDVPDLFNPELYKGLSDYDLRHLENYKRLFEGTDTVPGMDKQSLLLQLENNKANEIAAVHEGMRGLFSDISGRISEPNHELHQSKVKVGVKTNDQGIPILLEVLTERGAVERKMELVEQNGKLVYLETSVLLPDEMGIKIQGYGWATTPTTTIFTYEHGLEKINARIEYYQNKPSVGQFYFNGESQEASSEIFDPMEQSVKEFLQDNTENEPVNYNSPKPKERNNEHIREGK